MTLEDTVFKRYKDKYLRDTARGLVQDGYLSGICTRTRDGWCENATKTDICHTSVQGHGTEKQQQTPPNSPPQRR